MGYIFHFVTGRLLGPTPYGVVASAVAALYLLTLPALVMQTISMRFTSVLAAHGELGSVRYLLIRLSALNGLFGGLLVVGLLAGGAAAARFLQLPDQRLISVLAITALVTLFVSANRGVLQGLRRFAALSTNMIVDMATRVVIGAGLIVSGFGVIGALLGVLLGPALAYGQSFFFLRSVRQSSGPSTVSIGSVGRYALPTAIGVIGVTYLFNVDVVLAKHYLSPEAAGIYAAASVLARVVYFLGVTIAGVMFPEVAALHARNQAHFHVVDASLLFLLILGAALVGVYVTLPALVLLPYGAGFVAVRPYLGPFALALSLLAVANVLVNYFLSVNSPKFVPVLLGACVLETILVAAFHDGAARILTMVLITLGLLAFTLAALYTVERFGKQPGRLAG